MNELLIKIAEIGPVVSILIVAILYFLKREKVYNAKIDDLNKELRETEKDNLQLLGKLADTLDKLSENNKELSQEIRSIKELILLKINNYKNE